MIKRKLIQKTVTPILTAACVLSQIGIAWAGVYTQGNWQYQKESWKHYEASGTLSSGWIQKASGWYYLSPEDGAMMTGWFQDEKGMRYYLNTSNDGTEGQMRSGWYQDGSGIWYFFHTANDGALGAMKTGWQWIDGYCYYFNAADGADMGKMYTGQTTPDGYFVNGEGRWAEADGTVHYEAGRGLASTPAAENARKTASSSGGSSSSGSGSSSGESNTPNENNSSGNGNNGNNSNGDEGNNNGGNNSEGNNSEGNNSEEGNNQEDQDVFINEQRTKLVDLGWIQYAVIAFQEGSIDDYTIEIDGTDITEVCTNVDDDGTVVKWQTTLWKPGTITVIRASDGKTQEVKIGNSVSTEAPEMGSLGSAPSAILTNGSISVFDYWLDNYDKDGNVRVSPEKTTFRLNGKSQETSSEVPADYYIPDTLIDKNGNGKIQLKMSLKTLAQESWFDQLKTIKAQDPENTVLNKNLVFTTSMETEYGKTGVITIQLPQTNLFARGRYQLNLSSVYSKATMNVPLHLVDNRLFVMNLNALNPSPKQGEDFAFDIVGPDGETFGTEILSPIYRVDLTMPSGKVKSLTKIDQWYEIGPMLHICGTDPDGNVITDESGIYTVTAYANGYQTMTKKVEVNSSSQIVAEGFTIYAMAESFGIDAMSSASVVIPGDGGSGGSGSSGGSQMNGFLIFDHDMLANALILHEINYVSEYSEAVVQWWYDQKAQAVMDENAEIIYDFTHYLNAVKDAKLEAGEYLSFEKYKETQTGGETGNRPYQIKRVLEDGKLGTVESFLSVVGKSAPALKGMEGKLGEDLVLSSDKDGEYISKITALYLDGSAIALRSDEYITAYKTSETKESVTILSKTEGTGGGTLQLTEGEHKLRIMAEGYKEQTVILNVVKELEQFNLSLAENPDKTDSEEATAYHVGQMVYINAAADEDDESQKELRGDFMKNFTGVTLTDPDDNIRKVLSSEQGGMFSQDNYEKGDYSFALQKNLFQKAGMYTVLVTAEGYTAKTLTFEILEAAGNPVENEKPAPDVAATKYVKASFWDPAYYRVTFDVTDEQETKEYLNADKAVTVNGIPYKKTSMLSTSRPNEYKVSKDEAYGVVKYLDFTEDGFTEEENEVIIEVDGYGTLTFMVELFDPEAGMEGKSASAAVKVEEEAVETEEGKTEEAKEETVETEEDKTEEAEEETVETEEETVETVVDKTEEGKDETVEVEEGKTEEGKDETVENEAGKTEEAKDETVETKEEENGKEAADSKEEEIQEETAETKEKSSDSQEKEPEDEVKIGKTADVTVEE
ncbi:hemoblobin-interacting domain-containing protein [Lacrimispora indolis]|uniref:hemoblobin-interacting domain-containing protein n=1 Tax=Lacrimispora indolis TaxID=69825 RepID=UPI0004296859|nr:hypothetical protein [[Clostridium] methoxybenzovorans]